MSDQELRSVDLDHAFALLAPLWEEFRGRRIFLTGGTGFFGCWLLTTFLDANARLGLDARLTVLTRDGDAFAAKMPAVAADPATTFLAGDVRDFAFPDGPFDYVIHAATDASAKLNAEEPLTMIDVVADGTRRVLEFARQAGAKRFLLTSSGAVYGRQPPDMPWVDEEYRGAPDTLAPASAYGEGKRFAETLCAIYARQYGMDVVIARCWAFVGPYLPLDRHFAIGNFIRDGMNGGPIEIGGDGTPYRSYLYGADLAVHLWTLLARGQNCRAYNVGSDEAVTIRELAETVARCCEEFTPAPVAVRVARVPTPGQPAERYVPSVRRIAAELGLSPTLNLRESIRRTIAFHRQTGADEPAEAGGGETKGRVLS